ncbi:MAG: hypothetical protein ABIH65_00075 [Nanoarchaeota archaeon]
MVIPWILLSVGVLIIILAVFAVMMNKGKKYKIDYYSFFIMGITWLPMGIVFRILFPETFIGFLFISLGAIYTIIGLIHKNEWKKNSKSWKQLSKKQRRIKAIISIILGLLVSVGLALYLVFR